MHPTHPRPESLIFCNQCVTVGNGVYNISYAISALESLTIDKILVKQTNITDPTTNTDINGATIYINSTTVDTTNPLNYLINCGNNFQLNFILPCTEIHSTEISIMIFSPQVMYYRTEFLQ